MLNATATGLPQLRFEIDREFSIDFGIRVWAGEGEDAPMLYLDLAPYVGEEPSIWMCGETLPAREVFRALPGLLALLFDEQVQSALARRDMGLPPVELPERARQEWRAYQQNWRLGIPDAERSNGTHS